MYHIKDFNKFKEHYTKTYSNESIGRVISKFQYLVYLDGI